MFCIGWSSRGNSLETPALFMRATIGNLFSCAKASTACTAESTWMGLVTSSIKGVNDAGPFLKRSKSFLLRTPQKTRYPAPANAAAAEYPIPLDAPVTRITPFSWTGKLEKTKFATNGAK